MTDIKLFYHPGACSLAPHILLQESGVQFHTQKETIGQFSPELLALNPKARVPVLKIDNATITENLAIMTAISNLVPEKQFLGAPDTLETVRVAEWIAWLSGTLHGNAFGLLFRPARFTDDESCFDSLKQKGRELVRECFESIEKKLVGVHAVGERFTAVDAYLLVFYRWGGEVGFDMKMLYPKYAALATEVLARPSAVSALAAEGLKSN
ncbi:glutathione S-transferase GST-6.0 [Penicillium nucicola]|uniref:glutathione S-transferase GST-6.0 n=1 Tax=Penicillium nucicola TaxID=1850975 RepID=UPI002544F443|nr:glutathione S-transferase GST-6.0 [Penicillium nucicola]KAJ5770678.1 glutathione S-transferase GST-6.0 [Penicillium nucicola]